MTFQSFDYEGTWWKLFQRLVVCTKLDIYFFKTFWMGICIFADQLIFYSVDQLIVNSIYHKIYPIVQYYKAISLRTILKLRVKFVLNTVTSRMFVWHLHQCIMLNVVEIVASVYVCCLMLFHKFALCLLLKCSRHICRTYKLET